MKTVKSEKTAFLAWLGVGAACLCVLAVLVSVVSLRDGSWQRSSRTRPSSPKEQDDLAGGRDDASPTKTSPARLTDAPASIHGQTTPATPPPLPDLALPAAPDLALDRDPDMGTPRFVRRRSGYLSGPAPGTEPEAIAVAFIAANGRAFTLHPSDIQPPNARIVRDVTTRHNGMRSLTWQQQNDGIDIFGATFVMNLARDNRIINVQSRALHLPSVRFHDAVTVSRDEAVRIAARHLSDTEEPRRDLGSPAQPAGTTQPAVPRRPAGEIVHQQSPICYPLDQISVVKAWDIIIERKPETHRTIIRADTGDVVEDINLTWSLEAATFNVFTNDSPEPMTPGADTPTNGVAVEASRTNITIIALSTNASPEGWIPAGENRLIGNNANVYADWDDNDGPDSPALTGITYRVFDYPMDLTLNPSTYTDASRVQAFYTANFFHDRLYSLGFDESAGNFQGNNYGRGGTGGDPLFVEVQNDFTARAGGLYGITAWYTGYGDGSRGTVSINTATVPPRRDGALDAQLLLHEAVHGVSTRLIGNGFGLTTVQSRGMGEGWSDFMPLALLAEPDDVPTGTYPFGSYVSAGYDVQHLYFGVRRFPYCTDTNKAPQTIADTDPNQIDFPSDVPRNTYFGSEDADQVHNIGEVWCLAMWECRANLMERHGFTANETIMQLVVDGMKLTPENPTFVDARDAILQADLVNHAGVNQILLWKGFAKRGLGYGATVPPSVSTVGIVESYGLPFGVTSRVEESSGDGDGYVEPDEDGELTIVLTSHEMALTNVTASLSAVSSNVTIGMSNAVLPSIEAGGTATSAPPLAFAVDVGFSANTDAEFLLRVESDRGWFEESVAVHIGNPYDYPPQITGIAVTNLAETNAWASWQTGIPSQCRVNYGTTTNYGFSTPLGVAWSVDHLVELPGLTKGTVYHYQIAAHGTNGQDAVSEDRTFRTRDRVYVSAWSTATQELGTIDAPFRSLQAAAEAASLTGDEILVAMGTYTSGQSEAVLDLDGTSYDLTVKGGYKPDFTECDPDLYETVLDGQHARRGISLDNGAALTIGGVTITHGLGEWGGGVHVRSSRLIASECMIKGNASTTGINKLGGGLYATLASTVQVDSSVFQSNTCDRGGGLFVISSDTHAQITDCLIDGNAAAVAGGGVRWELGASVDMDCCVVSGNRARYIGGGVSLAPFCSGHLTHVTVAMNAIDEELTPGVKEGGGVSLGGTVTEATLTMQHLVSYSNSSPFSVDLLIQPAAEAHARYCDFGDISGTLTTSNNVISADPVFASPEAGDFHLLYGSPCIDAGSTNAGGSMTDMDGEARPFGVAMDMGSDEFVDTDSDHMADYWENLKFGNLAADGTNDPDGDLLDDFGEYMNQTDPHDRDTDGDLAEDGWEVANGYDPIDCDQDNDGMWDGWEVNHSLNAFVDDASLDPDGDTHDNLQEFGADTNPQDSNSVLQMLHIGREYEGVRIDWKGGVDAWQWLETTRDLSGTTSWDSVIGFPPPTPVTNAIVDFGATNGTLFYRIRAER